MSQDDKLRDAVIAELAWEPSIVAAHIGVAADHGVITLTGHVDSFVQKYAAESAASRVNGVKALAEEIEVRLPLDSKIDDADIAAAAIARLAWNTSVPPDTVKVKSDKGWITLTGQVAWHYQKDAAEHEIRRMAGVVGLFNQITIMPTASPIDISNNITYALHRSWFETKTIAVSAKGGIVKLAGTAHSYRERQIAGDTAWAAPGTINVENDITVI